MFGSVSSYIESQDVTAPVSWALDNGQRCNLVLIGGCKSENHELGLSMPKIVYCLARLSN